MTTTREQVLAAAQRHLNVDPTASMAVLARAAGVGRATLHRHFATRDDLVHEIASRSLDRWEESQREAGVEAAVASGDPETLRACLTDVLSRFVTDADEFGFALTDSYMTTSPALLERSDALFAREVALYDAAQQAGVLRSDVSARWLGHAVYGLLVAAREALREGEVARRDLDAVVVSTFLEGGAAR